MNDNVEKILLAVVQKLDNDGKELYEKFGTASYQQRCDLHDAKEAIYELTNEYKEKLDKANKLYKDIKK